MKRQFCCKCLRTTSDYITEVVDQRTPAEVQAGRPAIERKFHTCLACGSES
jgi:hypothetical protein